MPHTWSRILRWASAALVLSAIALTIYAWVGYSAGSPGYPAGTTIAGIAVGGLGREEAAARISSAYGQPIQMRYQNVLVQANPVDLGFSLKLDEMLDQAEQGAPLSFWNDLWNQTRAAQTIPLQASVSGEALRAYLVDEISARYDRPAQPAMPRTGEPYFDPPAPGNSLDVDQAALDVERALFSPVDRQVTLSIQDSSPPRLPIANLQFLLERTLVQSGYGGLAEVYLQDLGSQEIVHFAISGGGSIEPDVAYSAASIIKIPIMISVYRRIGEPAPENILALLERMIEESDNTASDQVAQAALDANLAPMLVTEDLRALGLENTFWAGFFYMGAPLLDIVTTPANTRADVNTNPDIYSQVTPGDVGWLLSQVYACAKEGSGKLTETWPGEITAAECRQMIELLKGNHLGMLVQAGLPDGVPYAHKHGWAVDAGDGLLHDMADAGIVFTKGGDYVLTVFFHQDGQLQFDPVNTLFTQIARISSAYFETLPVPAE